MSKFGGCEDKPFLAELYDLVPGYSGRRDLQFYLDLCRDGGGKVLELGCGTGRVLLPVASAGVDIVGLDLSEHMLSKCREKVAVQPQEVQDRIRLVRRDHLLPHGHDRQDRKAGAGIPLPLLLPVRSRASPHKSGVRSSGTVRRFRQIPFGR